MQRIGIQREAIGGQHHIEYLTWSQIHRNGWSKLDNLGPDAQVDLRARLTDEIVRWIFNRATKGAG